MAGEAAAARASLRSRGVSPFGALVLRCDIAIVRSSEWARLSESYEAAHPHETIGILGNLRQAVALFYRRENECCGAVFLPCGEGPV